MIKGILSAIIGAVIISALILGLLYFLGFIILIAKLFMIGLTYAVVIVFLLLFVFFLVSLFLLFYYMAEKKPTVTPGEYKLEMEKGKGEN